MPLDELNEWKALEQIDGPIDTDYRRDWSTAKILAQSAAAATGHTERVADHLPQWSRPPLEPMAEIDLWDAFNHAADLFEKRD